MSAKIEKSKKELNRYWTELRAEYPLHLIDGIKRRVDAVILDLEAEIERVRIVPANGKNNPRGKVVVMEGDEVIGAQG